MPIVAYQRAHGANDYMLHHLFFEALERRGVLDRIEIAIDVFLDPLYARQLVSRFPQLVLATDLSRSRKIIETLKATFGKGYRWVAMLDKRFDAVVEAPGGRLNVKFCGNTSNWWLYPRAQRRAVMFHSLDEGCADMPRLRDSIAEADLFIARTSKAATIAKRVGCQRVVTSSDIVFQMAPGSPPRQDSGIAVGLRHPGAELGEPDTCNIRSLLDFFESQSDTKLDMVRVEDPIGGEMYRRGYHVGRFNHIRLFSDDGMYLPFMARRDAVISCRLHTLIVALVHGNRRIFQAQTERATNKIGEIAQDIGLYDLKIHGQDDVSVDKIRQWIDEGQELPDQQVVDALSKARVLNENGLDAACDWFDSL